jgi:hypothetical protein
MAKLTAVLAGNLKAASTIVANTRLGTTPKGWINDSHDNWSREKWDNGWVWGEVKDPEAKTHPNLVPYSALPAGERAKDALFGAIVRALSD